mmetsp:Transcript_18293/g.41963  ORF Transcript_18293/g.41963 Transcript_18293/m.41963 type:complete len:414 (+) Transcript_18293:204-1445(+)|eukprot:CAMPEP_0172406688 /NCGR_PEP_ID=MMETSP1061-20121228/71608_1 /TAXON_ID=37318 /ORGANISM="Pseudo-nitzschia pungens, Strain cf. pungens" /LENGTH=413 /DNA_ID=CAMNT_0013142389 /DNA_START=148 /DNA_END=1389 /DNA_ORIENTATION=-
MMFDSRAIVAALLATAVSFSDAFQQPISVGGITNHNVMSSSISTSSTRLQMSTEAPAKKQPGTADMDKPWEKLGFEFRPTNSHVQLKWKEGEGWSKPEIVKEPYVNLHIGATVLHYGQACFEGLKAFTHADGDVYSFRPEENAARMQSSCRRIMMPELPTELFCNAVQTVVKDNIEFVPPYGTGGALYIRPLLFGSGPRIGLQPADEYTFVIMVMPVADYYEGGLSTPVDALIITDYDRAAPQGVGAVKVAGNYAADLLPNMKSKKKGYPIGLYLDAKTQQYVEEFSTSNFVGIDNKNKKFVTPKSPSVLPSITNKSLMQIAADEGYIVEARNVGVEELKDFDEVLAVGTAVVVTPVGSATILGEDGEEDTVYRFGKEGELGETTKRLYQRVRAIQNGDDEDTHGWNMKINND